MKRAKSHSRSMRGVIFGVFAICSFFSVAKGAPWDGNGVEGDPYLIYDANDMQAIGADSNYWDAHFKLMADINLIDYNGSDFNIIGEYVMPGDPCNQPFVGVFDGNGHTISNFSYVSPGASCLGIFRYVDEPNAEIRNVGMIAADVNAGTGSRPPGGGICVGALVGYLEHGSVTGCYVIESKVCGNQKIGGLVGLNTFGEIQDCNSADTTVIGNEGVGGLVGRTGGLISNCCVQNANVGGQGYEIELGGLTGYNEGTILKCYTRGSIITGEMMNIGGLVGLNYSTGIISSCYSEDNIVTGHDWAGGLAGANWGTITNCHSDCLVVGGGEGSEAGVLVGGTGGDISKCYSVGRCIGADWDEEGPDDCFWIYADSGVHIGIELSTAEMMTKDTFTDAGWDFNTPIWVIDEGNDYPRLWWEGVVSPGRYGGGRGLPTEPYLIYDANDMQEIGTNRKDWHKHFKLMADIDLGCYSGEEFNIIGEYVGWLDPFNLGFIGVFDGNGRTISNFSYSSDGDRIGIFEYVDGANGVIKNLGLIDPNVHGGDIVGSLVAIQGFFGGGITNCYVEGGVVSGGMPVGGLIGSSCNFVSRCYSTASVIGGDAVGGLAGSTVGLETPEEARIKDCYSRGDVSGDTSVGGLVGWNYKGFGSWTPGVPANISNCYSAGAVSGNSDVGGLIGINGGVGGGDVNDCFWDVNSSGQASSSGGTGKTTAEMQMRGTFTDAGWDFVGEIINGPNDIWKICEGTNYPKLSWQVSLMGDFVCPDGVEINDLTVLCEEWLLEEIPADVWPVGGDGIVNLFDWAIFADQWQTTVDFEALTDFATQWLKTGAAYYIADVAPSWGGDGIVNMGDFAVLANNWLEGD